MRVPMKYEGVVWLNTMVPPCHHPRKYGKDSKVISMVGVGQLLQLVAMRMVDYCL